MGGAVTLFLRLTGALLLSCAGAGIGLSAAACWADRLREVHTFARLLDYLAALLETQALTGQELLHRAARSPDFAVFCPVEALALAELRPPGALPAALREELASALTAAAESPRPHACAALRRLAALCEQDYHQRADACRAARRLWPKLGGCLGLLAAILAW